jgi:hypothetical protein
MGMTFVFFNLDSVLFYSKELITNEGYRFILQLDLSVQA